MIFYFSGTGNSRYCAKRLAHRLGDEAVDAFPFLRDDHFPALTSRSPWVFVSPTYGWQLPRKGEALLRGGRGAGRAPRVKMAAGGLFLFPLIPQK